MERYEFGSNTIIDDKASIESQYQKMEIDREIYLENTITSGVSTANPYGAFTMNYTMTNAEAGFLPQGATVGEGYLNVSGTKAEFIERTFGNSEP